MVGFVFFIIDMKRVEKLLIYEIGYELFNSIVYV